MEMTAWPTLAIFTVTIAVVITEVIDRSVAALFGVGIMVWAGVMSEVDAFLFMDCNVMAILLSIWVITGYIGKTGVPEWLSVDASRLSGGHLGLLVLILLMLAGFLSIVADQLQMRFPRAQPSPLAPTLKLAEFPSRSFRRRMAVAGIGTF